ncbi:FitA-like ribbon-helix-helix domain-containing protein [Mixta intestinalis]|uniref:FitA-like ribbon-helix-helix domain-containing protein n=1 Tax=Mixta intestinalis TaxID=1615494 RepID=UPI00136A391A|nr:hypothetical protein [Mixta intestinalis]
MAKIQARNIEDALHERIEQAAMKNDRSVEAEVRVALREKYMTPPKSNVPPPSMRERWQQETGERLRQLFDRLTADNWFRTPGHPDRVGVPELIRLARRLDVMPGLLMDIQEGHQPLTLSLADAIAAESDASADWLLSGSGSPFPTVSLGMDYHDFFLPDGGNIAHVFEFIRISRGRHAGTLLCLRIHPQTRSMALGAVTAEFMLCNDGTGGTGHGKLLDFLLFLKTRCAGLSMNAFDFVPDDPDFDFWSVVGWHHPVWFQDFRRRTTAGWLAQLLRGEDPDRWFRGWEPDLEKIRDTPFGGDNSVSG